jgi:hypothetical protein
VRAALALDWETGLGMTIPKFSNSNFEARNKHKSIKFEIKQTVDRCLDIRTFMIVSDFDIRPPAALCEALRAGISDFR